jgi:hypothetical protein
MAASLADTDNKDYVKICEARRVGVHFAVSVLLN